MSEDLALSLIEHEHDSRLERLYHRNTTLIASYLIPQDHDSISDSVIDLAVVLEPSMLCI